jgi:hypothetical protein
LNGRKNELERIWKEVIMEQFKVLFQNLDGGTEGNHEKPLRVTGFRAEI